MQVYGVYVKRGLKKPKTKQKTDLLLCAVNELIFIGPFPAGPHTLVLPEDLCMVIKLLEREKCIWINDIPQLEKTASQALTLEAWIHEIKI